MALGGGSPCRLKSLLSTAPVFQLINSSLSRWGPNIFPDSQTGNQTFLRCLICMNKISPSTWNFLKCQITKSHSTRTLRIKTAGMKRLEVNHWHIHSLIGKAFTHIYYCWGQWHAHISLCRHTDPLKETTPILWFLPGHASSDLPCKEGSLFWGTASEWQRSSYRRITTGYCGTGKEGKKRKAGNIMRRQMVASSNHPMLPGFWPHQ